MKQFYNEELNLRARIIFNDNKTALINLEDAIVGFGWTYRKDDINYIDLDTYNRYARELGIDEEFNIDNYISEKTFYTIGTKANSEIAYKFKSWIYKITRKEVK